MNDFQGRPSLDSEHLAERRFCLPSGFAVAVGSWRGRGQAAVEGAPPAQPVSDLRHRRGQGAARRPAMSAAARLSVRHARAVGCDGAMIGAGHLGQGERLHDAGRALLPVFYWGEPRNSMPVRRTSSA